MTPAPPVAVPAVSGVGVDFVAGAQDFDGVGESVVLDEQVVGVERRDGEHTHASFRQGHGQRQPDTPTEGLEHPARDQGRVRIEEARCSLPKASRNC